jgi:hypothetical protein
MKKMIFGTPYKQVIVAFIHNYSYLAAFLEVCESYMFQRTLYYAIQPGNIYTLWVEKVDLAKIPISLTWEFRSLNIY